MQFDPEKHHRRSIRLKGHDYSQPAAYFITIVAWRREMLFGDIRNGTMALNRFGVIAEREWERLQKRFTYVSSVAFVVMPNHVHGILIIDKPENGLDINVNGVDVVDVETLHATSLPEPIAPSAKNEQMAAISPKPGSLPTIIRSYKSAVFKYAVSTPFPGNHVTTIILFATNLPIKKFRIILLTILPNGRRINFILTSRNVINRVSNWNNEWQ